MVLAAAAAAVVVAVEDELSMEQVCYSEPVQLMEAVTCLVQSDRTCPWCTRQMSWPEVEWKLSHRIPSCSALAFEVLAGQSPAGIDPDPAPGRSYDQLRPLRG